MNNCYEVLPPRSFSEGKRRFMHDNLNIVLTEQRTGQEPQAKRYICREEPISMRNPLNQKTAGGGKHIKRPAGASKIRWPKVTEFVMNNYARCGIRSSGPSGPPDMHFITRIG
jgi:hypothetical protein